MALLVLSLESPFFLCLPAFLSISTVTAIDQTSLASHPDNSSRLLAGLIAFSFSVREWSLKYKNETLPLSLGSLAPAVKDKIRSPTSCETHLHPHPFSELQSQWPFNGCLYPQPESPVLLLNHFPGHHHDWGPSSTVSQPFRTPQRWLLQQLRWAITRIWIKKRTRTEETHEQSSDLWLQVP